jgi:hypothetical protein
MKKNIIIASIFLTITIIVGYFITSYQWVTFLFETPSGNAELFNNGEKIKNIKNDTPLLLKNDTYTIRAVDSKYSKDDIEVSTTNNSRNIPIDFTYSSVYLEELLTPKELSAIQAALVSKYAQKLDGFTLNTGYLLGQGEWYVTTITKKVRDESEIPDIYRVVLKKEKGGWTIITTPSLVLSIPLNKTIPLSIIRTANDL